MAVVMLEELTLDGWKSFERATVRFGPLTLLVGANASGKSNLLDALRVLQGLAQGFTLQECLEGRREGGVVVRREVRGGFAEATFRGAGRFGLTAALQVGAAERVAYRVEVRSNGDPALTDEALERDGVTLFDAGLHPSDPLVNPDRPAPAVVRSRSARSVLTLFDRGAMTLTTANGGQDLTRLGEAVRVALASSTFYELDPGQMRGYGSLKARTLGARGEHLSGVLHALCQTPGRKADLVDWVSELCAPKVVDLDFVEVPELGDVLAVLVEDDGTRVSARSLSDGTLRFLGLLAAVLTAEPGALLFFEELEAGLHPMRLHLLLDLLERTTRARQVQVGATSHSPTALRELSREALADVVVFARHADAGGTVASRLGDLRRFDELATTRGVEHLFTTGWLERAL
ncbi:MAG: AAA family ATPase [Planctomycetota bacterium]|nr:AAA family ATPase [Planctomycetota bacterium]